MRRFVVIGMHRFVVLGLAVTLGACAEAGPAPRAPSSAPSAPAGPPGAGASSAAQAAPAQGPSAATAGAGSSRDSGRTIARSTLHAVVQRGLGAFLQHVELDDRPVVAGGKFVGFRIAALHDSAFWSGVDLKPGDVVTGVNGFPIERPEQAATVFDSLEVASELRVAYQRDGQPRELVYAIVDDR